MNDDPDDFYELDDSDDPFADGPEGDDPFGGEIIYRQINVAEVLRQENIVLTRESFLADPNRLMWQDDVRPEWVVEAYQTNAEFRDNLQYWIAREVRKTGSLGSGESWLEVLQPALSATEVAELYLQIRDLSQRLELEWRGEFEAVFPDHKAALPPPEPKGVLHYWASVLYQAMTWKKDIAQVRACLEGMQADGITPTMLPYISPESLKKGYEIFLYDASPGLGIKGTKGLTFVQMATHVGHTEIAALLIASGLEQEPRSSP
jgi:hypothetical protein